MASAAAGSWHQGSPDSDLDSWPQNLSGVQEMRECANSLCAQPPLLPSSDQLVLFPSFPCPCTPQVQAPAPSRLQPGKLGAAGWEQALPGKDRCKSGGFHMKRSCFE